MSKDSLPRMVFAEYQPSIQHCARDAVRQTLPGIDQRHVDVLASGDPPDEPSVIDGVEHLSRPGMRLFAKARDEFARPSFELPEPLVPSSTLRSYDPRRQHARRPGLQAHIVVGVFSIPVESIGQGAAFDLESDHVGPVGSRFRVNGKGVGD